MDHPNAPPNTGWAVSWEERPWSGDASPEASRRRRLAARGPYRAAIPAAIADREIALRTDLVAEAEDAVRALTRFDAEVTGALPGTDVDRRTELAPLASVLLRTESASSSEIEGITAGARALALAAVEQKAGPNARLITAHVTAMQRAISLAEVIDVPSILSAHEALLHDHEYARPGRYRESQVWIGSAAISPHTATFVPPHHERIDPAMDDLVRFVARLDLPILPHVAIAHAQFETIHPFVDGNGRIGRTLVHAMLRHHHVTERLTVPISAGLLTDTRSYFDALSAYREGDLAPIVERFTAATFAAIDNGRRLVTDLSQIFGEWSERLRARRGSSARRLLPLLLSQPAITVPHLMASLGVASSAAQRAIEQLEGSDIVQRVGTNRRHRVWVSGEVIDALDRFAARSGRRR